MFVLARPGIYEAKGEFQLGVTRMIPTAAIGAAQRELERVKEVLQRDGLTDPARKRPIPELASTVAVVTSTDGAALRDIITVVGKRWPCCRLVVVNARVQGDGAVRALVRALELVNRIPDVELCIVGRGGGAPEDLAAFNSEAVCRALAAVRVPTISAVGHETDVSLTDLVADVRAPTPSAAAEMAVADRREVLRQLDDLGARLAGGLGSRTQTRRGAAGAHCRPAPRRDRGRAPPRAPPRRPARRTARRAEPAPHPRPRLRRAGGSRRPRPQAPGGLPPRRALPFAGGRRRRRRPGGVRMSIAQDLNRLEEIVRRLEADDVELDAALALFEEGVARLRAARERLASAEVKVQTVLEEAGDLRLTDLDG